MRIEGDALLVFAKEGDTRDDGEAENVSRAFVFVGADVGECVADIFDDIDWRVERVLVGVPVGVLVCSGDFVVVRLTVVDPVVVVVPLTVFDMDTVRDAVVVPDVVFETVVLPVVVSDCGDLDKRLLRVCDGEPDAVRVGGAERVCDGSAVIVLDRMAVNEFVGLPLMVLLVDGEAVVVLLIVLVRVDEGDPVCVAVPLEDHENAGDEDGLFDAVVVRVEMGEAHAVCVPNHALGVARLVDLLVTEGLDERVLVFDAVADVDGTTAKTRAAESSTIALCDATGESNSTNNNATRIMVSTWTIGLDLKTHHVQVLLQILST